MRAAVERVLHGAAREPQRARRAVARDARLLDRAPVPRHAHLHRARARREVEAHAHGRAALRHHLLLGEVRRDDVLALRSLEVAVDRDEVAAARHGEELRLARDAVALGARSPCRRRGARARRRSAWRASRCARRRSRASRASRRTCRAGRPGSRSPPRSRRSARRARERAEQHEQHRDRGERAQRVGRELAVLELFEPVHEEARKPAARRARTLRTRAPTRRRRARPTALPARIAAALGAGAAAALRGRARRLGRGGVDPVGGLLERHRRDGVRSGAGAPIASARLAIASAHKSVSAATRERCSDMDSRSHRPGEAVG